MSQNIRYNLLLTAILICIPIFSTACRTPYEFQQAIPTDNSFRINTAQNKKKEAYDKSAAYSESQSGLAVLIWQDGAIRFEQYQNGHSATQPAHIFSGTKTFTAALTLAAITEQKFTLDEPVSQTLTEWQSDPCKKQITVRQLLNFTSGLEQQFWRLSRDGMFIQAEQRVADKYEYAIGLDCKGIPGQTFEYGSSHHTALGAFLKRKLGQDPLAYLDQRVLRAIGLRYAGWHRDPAGNPMLPYGAWLTAREWLRFGIFLLERGSTGKQRIITTDLFDQMLQGSTGMPAYGLSVWLNRVVPENQQQYLIPQLRFNARQGKVIWPAGPGDLYAAAGFNGNRLYIFPASRMVVVRLGKGNSFQDQKFLDPLQDFL